MSMTTTMAKVVEILVSSIQAEGEIMGHLLDGNLYEAELSVRNMAHEVFNGVMERLLQMGAERVNAEFCEEYQRRGFKSMELRPLDIELHTGHRVKVRGMYAKRVDTEANGSRHLLVRHWSVNSNCSPLRTSQVAMCAGLSPSYDVGNELIKGFGPVQSTSRVRKITQEFADWTSGREVALVLGKGETLEGKRVALSMDGGRTRTREYKKSKEELGGVGQRSCPFDAPWREPKVFVIQVLDEKGEVERKALPIYGARFAEDDVLALLLEYLKALHVERAAGVQIVADGAPWIWNNLKRLLLEVGVCESKIVETLDYPHASGYLSKIIEQMPKRSLRAGKDKLLTQFKELLWQGNALKIVEKCRAIFKRPSQECQRWINYLEKHSEKTQYAHFKANKWLCGSGIIESGIRRVVNLRFKNPGTFWYKDNVEKLFLIRSVCLAKRWATFMDNYVNLEHS